MRGAAATLVICAALALAPGCGSTRHPAGSTSEHANEAPGAAATTASQTATGKAGLQLSGTPKFARPSRTAPVRSGRVRIEYRNITIKPDTVRVRVGSTLVWTNELGKGNSHTLDNIPFVLVGNGLDFRMGRAIKYPKLPHNRLLLPAMPAVFACPGATRNSRVSPGCTVVIPRLARALTCRNVSTSI